MNIDDRDLMAELVGALEPGDHMAMLEVAGQDAGTAVRRAGLGFIADLDPGPSPAISMSPSAPVLGDDVGYRPGDRLSIAVEANLDPQAVRVAIHHQGPSEGKILFPQSGAPWPTLEIFRGDDAERHLDLVVEGPPGAHAYTVAIVAADLFLKPWPADDPRWQRLWDAVKGGTMTGRHLEIEVAPVESSSV